ncbi:MAG: radical SAM protein, partial [Candidatus Altiarchaeota archaeon]
MFKRSMLFYKRARIVASLMANKWFSRRKPVIVYLFPTNRCNLRCIYCCVDHSVREREFTKDEIHKLIDELADMGTRMIALMGGEPTIIDGIGEVIDHIKRRGMLCDMVTNGQLIEEKIDELKGLDSMTVSVDGPEEANDKNRGKGSYKKLVKGIKLAQKNGIAVRVNAVLVKNTLHTIKEHLVFARDNNLWMTFGIPLEKELEGIILSPEEMVEAYKEIKKLKDEGYPVLASHRSL